MELCFPYILGLLVYLFMKGIQNIEIRRLWLFFQRFALAAVEFHGVIYVTGGYDGNDYLQ